MNMLVGLLLCCLVMSGCEETRTYAQRRQDRTELCINNGAKPLDCVEAWKRAMPDQ